MSPLRCLSHRHRRQRQHGPPPPEPDDGGGHEDEGAESEVRTTDPTVDVTPAGSVNYQRHGQPRQGDRHAGGQAGGHQQADQIEALTAAIQRLADNKRKETTSSTDSWVSAMEPQRGVRWRSGAPPQPPSWTCNSSDLRAY